MKMTPLPKKKRGGNWFGKMISIAMISSLQRYGQKYEVVPLPQLIGVKQ
jgi:hypothetical protein